MVKKCKKAFTLIEIIISMAIMGMVMMIIYSLFFSNYKTMNNVNSGVELQSQGEEAMNYLVDAALSANEVNYYIKDSSINKATQFKKIDSIPDNIKISEISFTTVKYDKTDKSVNNNYKVIFLLEENNEYKISSGEKSYNLKVKKSENDDDGITVGQFISSIEIKPLFEGRPFSEISNTEIGVDKITGIEFTITLKKWESGKTGRAEDLMIKTISNKVNFRNKY
jgi:prepilin-type N-terminal cleavage/methylation domain-containing protein